MLYCPGMALLLFYGTVLLLYALQRPRLLAHPPEEGDPFSRERTSITNALFVFLIFASHLGLACGDQCYHDPLNAILMELQRKGIGQLVVSTFFFFSGYGIMLSLKRKGMPYGRRLLLQRFPTLYLNTVIFGLVIILVDQLLYHDFSYRKLVEYTSTIRTWFITTTLVGYLCIAAAVFAAGTRRPRLIILITTILLILYLVVLRAVFHRFGGWLDTTLCIPAGMLFAEYREWVLRTCRGAATPAWRVGALVTLVGWLLYVLYPRLNYYWAEPQWGECGVLLAYTLANAGSALFAFGLAILQSSIVWRRPSRLLIWAGGSGLFYLYVFQEVVYHLANYFKLFSANPIALLVMSLSATFLLAWCMYQVIPRIDSLIFSKKA